MRREDWAQSNDPWSMLGFLRGKSSDRKLRLFGLTCCLHAGRFPEDESRAVLAIVEHYAEGLVGAEAMWQAFMLLPDVPGRRLVIPREFDTDEARQVAEWALGLSWSAPGNEMIDEEMPPVPLTPEQRGEREFQCRLLRDIIGYPWATAPFRPDWRTPDVLALASTACAERKRDGTLESGSFPILADALEDAGCHDAWMLDHLRGPGPHARGCWVLDRVLGKE